MTKPKLNPEPARTDLTIRECTKIIGGLLGSLGLMVDSTETLRDAVRWWAETDEAWTAINQSVQSHHKLIELLQQEIEKP